MLTLASDAGYMLLIYIYIYIYKCLLRTYILFVCFLALVSEVHTETVSTGENDKFSSVREFAQEEGNNFIV